MSWSSFSAPLGSLECDRSSSHHLVVTDYVQEPFSDQDDRRQRHPHPSGTRQGGRRRMGEGAGRAGWLWEWHGGWVEAIGRGMGYAGIAQKHYGNLQ